MNNEKFLFDMFCNPELGSDTGKAVLIEPYGIVYKENIFIVATDRFTLLKVPVELTTQNRTYKTFAGDDFKNVLDKVVYNVNIPLKTDLIKDVLDKLPKTDIEDCPVCKGEGLVSTKIIDEEVVCEKCNGDGHIHLEKGAEKPDYRVRIKLLEAVFQARYLKRLYDVTEIFKTDEIIITANHSNTANAFSVLQHIEVILMPVRQGEGMEIESEIKI
ncbi:MAG: hypothetical protein WC358_00045 [Ignavibacteria bacterium]|jgi:hypothetical protein